MRDESRHPLFIHMSDLEQKFDFALVGLAFSALALSIQFSTKMGASLPYLLISSWVLLFFSALVGGERLLYRPLAIRLELVKSWHADVITDLESRLQQGKTSELMAQAKKSTTSERLKELDATGLKIKAVVGVKRKTQLFLLILGLACNGIFSAANYLNSVYPDRAQPNQGTSNASSGDTQPVLNAPVAQPLAPKSQDVVIEAVPGTP